ncbi:hypothetical protein QFZ82_005950 [Streptomyces sp. V4I23]|nr:hypothetical protein [Streptomyces sp. V4I23]
MVRRLPAPRNRAQRLSWSAKRRRRPPSAAQEGRAAPRLRPCPGRDSRAPALVAGGPPVFRLAQHQERVEHHHDGGEQQEDRGAHEDGREHADRGVAGGGQVDRGVQMDTHRRHPDVVHPAHRDAHHEGGAETRQEAVHGHRRPQRGGRRDDGDHHGERDGEGVVLQDGLQSHSGHAEVVHGRDAESGERPARDQRHQGRAAVAHDEDPDADHDDGHGEAREGGRPVVANGGLLDGEPHHRDEVHRPDPRADGRGAERQPRRLEAAAVAHGPRGAAQAQGAAQAGHEIGRHRGDEAIAETVHRALHPLRPSPRVIPCARCPLPPPRSPRSPDPPIPRASGSERPVVGESTARGTGCKRRGGDLSTCETRVVPSARSVQVVAILRLSRVGRQLSPSARP